MKSEHADERVLLVAAAGGHLKQLHLLAPRFGAGPGTRRWVTFDTAQSRSLLAGEIVEYVRYPSPRDPLTNIRNLDAAVRVLRRSDIDLVVSTGSSVAVTFLPLAAAMGIPTHYIESVTRFDGPSMTGRILRRTPRVHLYCQHEHWADDHWRYRGSALDGFAQQPGQQTAVRKMVVTLGSAQDYPFRSLVERLIEITPPEVEVLWQTGPTPVTDLPIAARPSMPSDELESAMAGADVIVAHAGAGSSLAALEAGRIPVLVPRRSARGEHVDDHQLQIAQLLEGRGLAVVADADTLSWTQIESASGALAVRESSPPAFVLEH